MRTQKLIDLIRYEAKKRPEIAELLSRASDLTDEEIAEAKVPLPWFRNALKEARAVARKEGLAATVNEWASFGFTTGEDGLMTYWMGADCEIMTDRDVSILLVSGEPLFFPNSGGVWIDSRFSQKIDPKLAPSGTPCSRERYREAHRDWVTSRYT